MNPDSPRPCAGLEKRQLRGWLPWLCGWLVAVVFVSWHAVVVDRYLDRVTATRFTNEALATPLTRIPQAIAPDGQMWVRHSLALAESGTWRLRSTDIDNAPEGRPVYWNSAWALWLSACGRVRAACTGESLTTAIESASVWANLPVFIGVMTLASLWVWRRWGGAAGALMAVALAGHRKFYEGFYPAYCDHHGLINAAVLGVAGGALLAGAGWWRRDDTVTFSLLPRSEAEVMRAVSLSAICGALGLWVSAASLVVTIGITGVAVLGAALFGQGFKHAELACAAHAWRHWGRLGAGLSVVFYLLENFPDRLGFRLETNHPLYSLAWWAAGEGIAAVLVWRTEKRSIGWLAPRLGGWSVLVLVAPIVVWVRGAAVFTPLDGFLVRIHQSIHEFEPWWAAIQREGWSPHADQLSILFFTLVLLVVWTARKPPLSERLVVILIGVVALCATVLGCYQNRWLLTASAPQIGLVLVLSLALTAGLRPFWRAVVLVSIGAVLFMPGPWILARERLVVDRKRDVQMGEVMQLIYRGVADALLKEGADARSIVLTDPNASVGVGYYGRLRTVGTLYWENKDGLMTAAGILEARDDADAAARIHERGVTHVVLVSRYDFLSEYDYALSGVRSRHEKEKGFGERVLYANEVPVWLRPIEYRMPAPLVRLGIKVALFEVNFEAPASLAHERIGKYQLAQGARDLAETSFMKSLAADASRPDPWLLQGELMLSEGRLAAAVNLIRAGISRAPVDQHARLTEAAARLFTRQGAEGCALARELLDSAGGEPLQQPPNRP